MMFYVVLVAVLLWTFKSFIYRKIFPTEPLDVAKLGEWAVVTGATDGIGLAFAEELASKGLNLLLISRSMDKLEKVAQKISSKYSVSTKAIQAEFTLLDTKMYEFIEKELDQIEVGVLINNVGMSYVHPEYFHELAIHQEHVYQAIINCNMISAVKMCRFVLPGMVSRGRGLVVNVSSAFSEIPSPFLSLYGGSKAFLAKFSQDLGVEVEASGVRVHLLKTGMVATKLLRTRETSWMLPSPQTYVQSALKDIASLESRTSIGYIAHTITHNILNVIWTLFPQFAERKIFELGLSKTQQLRDRCKHCKTSTQQTAHASSE